MEYKNLKRSNPTHNLQNAFNVAEQKLGVTKLLDPEGERPNHTQLNADELLKLVGGGALKMSSFILSLVLLCRCVHREPR